MIKSLSETEFKKGARNALSKLYGTEDPDLFTFPFSEKLEKSFILYDYFGYLESELLGVIRVAAMKMGDEGFYLTIPTSSITITIPDVSFIRHWYIPFGDETNYQEQTQAFAYYPIHYSPQGLWGIIPSEDKFSVLGGTQEFVDEVISLAPGLKHNVYRLLETWRDRKADVPYTKTDWIRRLMENVYGEKLAQKLMREVGIT